MNSLDISMMWSFFCDAFGGNGANNVNSHNVTRKKEIYKSMFIREPEYGCCITTKRMNWSMRVGPSSRSMTTVPGGHFSILFLIAFLRIVLTSLLLQSHGICNSICNCVRDKREQAKFGVIYAAGLLMATWVCILRLGACLGGHAFP